MRQRIALGDIGNDHLRADGSDSQVLGKTFFIVLQISPQDAQKCESGSGKRGSVTLAPPKQALQLVRTELFSLLGISFHALRSN